MRDAQKTRNHPVLPLLAGRLSQSAEAAKI